MSKAYMNWSGGKDSALCLYDVPRAGAFDVSRLLTSVNSFHDRVSMHGVRRELLIRQARALNMPLDTIELPEQPGMVEYERAMHEKVSQLQAEGYKCALFGDIFLEDLRAYREQQLGAMGIEAVFPLWKQPSQELIRRFIQSGFQAMIVCVNEKYLDRSFCGRLIDEQFIEDCPAGVDICGENGEFHSFVFDGPNFSVPVRFQKGEVVVRSYSSPGKEGQESFYFCDLLPV